MLFALLVGRGRGRGEGRTSCWAAGGALGLWRAGRGWSEEEEGGEWRWWRACLQRAFGERRRGEGEGTAAGRARLEERARFTDVELSVTLSPISLPFPVLSLFIFTYRKRAVRA